jgi:hypothetical protein
MLPGTGEGSRATINGNTKRFSAVFQNFGFAAGQH